MGGFEVPALVGMEPTLKYHPDYSEVLTWARDPGRGHCLVGSLTGAVASQRVTEAPKGPLRVDGNHPWSVLAVRGLDCETDKSSRYESRS